MHSAHEEAGREFAARLKRAFPESVEHVFLFGSVARGETRGRDSDVDVLVTVASGGSVSREQVHEIAFEVTMEHGVAVTPHVVSQREYADRSSPLFETVAREGVAL